MNRETRALMMMGLIVLTAPVGCSRDQSPQDGGPASNTADGSNSQATSRGTEANNIPPQLVRTVEELIRLTTAYNMVADQVTDIETFKQHREELSRIDQQLSPLVEDVMIAEAKLTPEQKAEFESKYYVARAQPLVEEKARHKQRIALLVP
jgi:hypothetical protein